VAGPATVREILPLYGSIAPNAERMRDVAARYPGTIRSVAKKIGDPVKQGEALAVIESNESLQTYTLTAPLAGVVTARNANPGEQSGDKVLFTVADLSSVWVELSLFPRDAAKVRSDQAVHVRTADSATSGDGTIIYVAPVGTSASQTRNARVLLSNKNSQWAPGLYVTAEVTLSERTAPLVIAGTAVQNLEGKPHIFVRTGTGFVARELNLGGRDSEHIEVLSGLRVGESYAAANSYVLKAEFLKSQAADE
jgi:cobalt-zinc-cadmium efflux system membrane fusion protein